jgi:hypothetical protein
LENNNIIKDLEQEVKQDKILAFLLKNKYIIIFISIFILLLGITYSIVLNYNTTKSKKNSIDFYHIQDLLQKSNPKAKEELNKLIKNGNKGYKFLSYLNLFNYYLSQQDFDSAITTLEKAYKDNLTLDSKDFISYLLIATKIDLQNNNKKNSNEVSEYIKSHLVKSGSFYFINLELYVIYLIKNKDFTEAEKITTEILESPTASDEIKNRVNNLKSLINN